MSVQAMVSVFGMRGLRPAERLVLLAYANYAGPDGWGAYPAIPTVAHDCELDERTVRRALRDLEVRGYVERTGEHGVPGRSTTVYRVVMERGGAECPPWGDRRGGRMPPDPVIRSSSEDPDQIIKIGSEGSGGRMPPHRSPLACSGDGCDHSGLRRDWPCRQNRGAA